MTDFGLYNIGSWKDGQDMGFNLKSTVIVVSYDTKHNAYIVDINEVDDFKYWVTQNFIGDSPHISKFWDSDQTTEDVDELLDNVGVNIRYVI